MNQALGAGMALAGAETGETPTNIVVTLQKYILKIYIILLACTI